MDWEGNHMTPHAHPPLLPTTGTLPCCCSGSSGCWSLSPWLWPCPSSDRRTIKDRWSRLGQAELLRAATRSPGASMPNFLDMIPRCEVLRKSARTAGAVKEPSRLQQG